MYNMGMAIENWKQFLRISQNLVQARVEIQDLNVRKSLSKDLSGFLKSQDPVDLSAHNKELSKLQWRVTEVSSDDYPNIECVEALGKALVQAEETGRGAYGNLFKKCSSREEAKQLCEQLIEADPILDDATMRDAFSQCSDEVHEGIEDFILEHLVETEKATSGPLKTLKDNLGSITLKKAADENIEAIAKHFPRLSRLTIDSPDESLSADGLAHLAGMRHLRKLHVQNAPKLDGSAVKQIAKCKGLTTLSLSHCFYLSDKDIEPLESLENLRSLNLEYCGEIESLKPLLPLADKLERLEVPFCFQLFLNEENDEISRQLNKFSGLSHLDIRNTEGIAQDFLEIDEKDTLIYALKAVAPNLSIVR
jgi:hypothetical protein